MRLVFAGTPHFAAIQLNALIAAGHDIVLVLTQPDRPAGRGLSCRISEVKALALKLGLVISQPVSLREPAVQVSLTSLPADAWVVAAYGLILPAAILRAPPFGCINVHASLLPRWRGAAPIQRAIMAGDTETGVSILQMDEGLDTGAVYLQRTVLISDTETSGSLHERLATVGAQALVEVLARLAEGAITAIPQSKTGIAYAAKIAKDDAKINWSASAVSVARMIRALDPSPGAFTLFRGQTLKLWRAFAQDSAVPHPPGTLLRIEHTGIQVACGEGILVVTELQRSGGKRLPAGEFIRGVALRVGDRFGS